MIMLAIDRLDFVMFVLSCVVSGTVTKLFFLTCYSGDMHALQYKYRTVQCSIMEHNITIKWT